MLIIPAIDLKEGKCVRLEQGLMDKATVYSDDPATTAKHWEAQGAGLLHVVDLNGAFAGVPKNLKAIISIRRAVRMLIEVGGGIRDMATIRTLVSHGVDRIILGIDAKDGMVAIKGWAEVTKVKAADLAHKMQKFGAIAVIYTDIRRDGMLSGPNIEATKTLAEALDIPVIASGGVHTMKDIENLLAIRSSGVSGVITGKAIYSGSLNLKEAIEYVKTLS